MHKCNQSPIISVKKKEKENTSNSSLANVSQGTDSRTPGLAEVVYIQNPLGQRTIEKKCLKISFL